MKFTVVVRDPQWITFFCYTRSTPKNFLFAPPTAQHDTAMTFEFIHAVKELLRLYLYITHVPTTCKFLRRENVSVNCCIQHFWFILSFKGPLVVHLSSSLVLKSA